MNKQDFTKPWVQISTGCGIRIDSAKGNPICFIYGINKQAMAIADAVTGLDSTLGHAHQLVARRSRR